MVGLGKWRADSEVHTGFFSVEFFWTIDIDRKF